MHNTYIYILLNCEKNLSFHIHVNDFVRRSQPYIDEEGTDRRRGESFVGWFESYVSVYILFVIIVYSSLFTLF